MTEQEQRATETLDRLLVLNDDNYTLAMTLIAFEAIKTVCNLKGAPGDLVFDLRTEIDRIIDNAEERDKRKPTVDDLTQTIFGRDRPGQSTS